MAGVERQDAPTFDRTDGEVVEPALAYNRGGERQLTMGDTEANLHEGNVYEVVHFETAVADNGTIDIAITNGSTKNLHATGVASSGGDASMEIWEGVTVTVAGTAFTPRQRNRPSSNVSTATADINGTIDFTGAERICGPAYMPGGTGGQTFGNAAQGSPERILKLSETYLYRITNLAGIAKTMSLDVDWSEEDPIT